MRGLAIRYLVALARSQGENLAIGERRFQFAFYTENHVSLGAPVIGGISGRVFHHANANLAEILGSPEGYAGVPVMFGRGDLSPIRGGNRESDHLHESSIVVANGQTFGTIRCAIGDGLQPLIL